MPHLYNEDLGRFDDESAKIPDASPAATAQRAEEQAQSQLLQAARNLLATGMPIEQVVTPPSLPEAQVQVLQSSD